MQIKIDATVTCRGGWIGRVEGLVIEAGPLKATHIVIGGAGLKESPALLPWDSIEEVSAEGVRLLWSTTHIREASRTSGRLLPSGFTGIFLGRHTKIVSADHKGRLIAFELEDSARVLRNVVIEHGWLFKRTVSLTSDNFTVLPNGDLAINQVILSTGASAAGSDKEIEEELSNILETQAPFKASNRFRINALVRNGGVELYGNVRFTDDKREAEGIIKGASTSRKMKSYILSDSDLEIKLAQLISESPTTSDCRFSVSSYLGQIVIELWDSDTDLKAAVEELAKSAPGIVSLEVSLKDTPTPWEYSVVPKKVYTAVSASEAEKHTAQE